MDKQKVALVLSMGGARGIAPVSYTHLDVYKRQEENIPLFECPQRNFEEMYYYRWWSLRKLSLIHI